MVSIVVPYLVSGGNAFASSGTTTLYLYGAQTESVGKDSGLYEQALPLRDSDSKMAVDLLGAARTITYRGFVTVKEVANLYTFYQDLVGLLSVGTTLIGSQGDTGGGQVGYILYPFGLNNGNSGSARTVRVVVKDAKIDANLASMTKIDYTITFIEISPTLSA